MNKTQKGIQCFEKNLATMIANSRGEWMPFAGLIGVLQMAIDDLSKEASRLPVDGDDLHEAILNGGTR